MWHAYTLFIYYEVVGSPEINVNVVTLHKSRYLRRLTCRTREYLCARERIRDLHDWRSFAGLNSLCDILPPLSAASSLFLSIPFFYPSVSRSLSSLSFFPINEDVKLVPFLWRPAMTETIRNRKRRSERGGGGFWPPQLWRKDFITSCQISSCCRLRISEAGPERDCLWMCVCWKLKNVS